MNPWLSVIIPVYNVEAYLRQCLSSIVEDAACAERQVEVIVVDDGATDCSGAIADEIAAGCSCVRVIHKENAGVAAARNTGIKEAKGEWLYFVDSDDWLADGAVTDICRLTHKYEQADILLLDAYKNIDEKEEVWEHFETEQRWETMEDIEALQRGMLYFPLDFPKTRVPLAAPWDKVYRHSFVMQWGLCFSEELKVLDDMVFNVEAFGAAEQVVYCKTRVYHYRFVNASITNSYKADRVKLDCQVWKYLYQYGKMHHKGDRYWQAYYYRIVKSFAICCRLNFFNPKNPAPFSERLRYVRNVLSKTPYRQAFAEAEIKHAEWRLKVMILLGRFRCGLGVYVLHLANRMLERI